MDEINRAEMFAIKENESPLLFVISCDAHVNRQELENIKANWDAAWEKSGKECPAPLFFLAGGLKLELIKREDIKTDG